MSERKRRKRRLPEFCAECGGRMTYDFGPGDYIAGVCSDCTPVVEVRVPTDDADAITTRQGEGA